MSGALQRGRRLSLSGCFAREADTHLQACHHVVSSACQRDSYVSGWRVPLQEKCELHVSVLTISHLLNHQCWSPHGGLLQCVAQSKLLLFFRSCHYV